MSEEQDDRGKNRLAMVGFGVGCLFLLGVFGCGPFVASAFWLSGG